MQKFKKAINRKFQFFPLLRKYDLLIVDDTMPDIFSGFKIEEFSAYQKEFNMILYCDLFGFKQGDARKNFDSLEKEFHDTYNGIFVNFKKLKLFSNVRTDLAYCIFLNNIKRYYKYFEAKKIYFGYTLYPGGGFNLKNENTKRLIKNIHSSKYFKFVIVNQKIIKEYLIENDLCPAQQIHYIHGTPFSLNYIKNIKGKLWFKKDKETFDIAFIAHKYTVGGVDKGLDILMNSVKKLSEKHSFIRVHIVGSFNSEDIPKDCKNIEVKLYGTRPISFFSSFFKNIDTLVSPNRPNVMGNGSFDGFPLTTAVIAGLHGIPLVLSDELKQNTILIENKEFLLITPKVEDLTKKLDILIEEPSKLELIGNNGKQKLQEVYSYNYQIKSRLDIIKKNM